MSEVNHKRHEDDPISNRWPNLVEFAGNTQELGSLTIIPHRTRLRACIIDWCYRHVATTSVCNHHPASLNHLEYEYTGQWEGYFWITTGTTEGQERKYRMGYDQWEQLIPLFSKLPK